MRLSVGIHEKLNLRLHYLPLLTEIINVDSIHVFATATEETLVGRGSEEALYIISTIKSSRHVYKHHLRLEFASDGNGRPIMFDNALVLAFGPLCHHIEGSSHGMTPSSSTRIAVLATNSSSRGRRNGADSSRVKLLAFLQLGFSEYVYV